MKLNFVDLQLIKNNSLAKVFCCKICEICRDTFLAEHHRTTASGELANKTVNYDTKTKA